MPKKASEAPLVVSLLGPKDDTIKEMFKQGLHWGHRASRWHPHIKPFLHGTHRNVHVFDLNKTYDYLLVALEYLKEASAQRKYIFFVGTRGPEKEFVKALCQELELPGVWQEWVGGMFTNFKEVTKRIKYFRELEEKITSGELEKYTKRERHEFTKEYEKMLKKWEGVKHMERLPDIIFMTNIYQDELALKEARRMGIPVVAITDSNTDPTLVNFPIPANDDAITSVRYILERVRDAIKQGRETSPQVTTV